MRISPDSWRKYFKPAYRAMIETAHNLGLDVWLHSCGNITDIISDLIEIELDVIGNLQPSALDLPLLSEKYGRQITFFGGIDVQYNIINGNRDTICDEVYSLMKNFRAEQGKYMCCPSNSIMPETPVQNARYLFEAIREFGSF